MRRVEARLASVATALSQAMLIMSGALLVVILPVNGSSSRAAVGPSPIQRSGSDLRTRHDDADAPLECGDDLQLALLRLRGSCRSRALADGVLSIVLTAALDVEVGAIGAPIPHPS